MRRLRSERAAGVDRARRGAGFAAGAIAALVAAAGAGCSEGITSCEDLPGLHPVCGFQNPEDLAPVGDGRRLLVSEMGGMLAPEAPGQLSEFDPASEIRRRLYPAPGPPAAAPAAGWGDPACPGPPGARLNPHGIDLAPRPDGRLRLLVVNHGGRESVEFFEAIPGDAETTLAWRGCAVAPAGLFLNDVVNLPDGGFLATHMLSGHPVGGILRSRLGIDTGEVWEWQPPAAWAAVPGTAAPFPNGIEVSPDGADVYLNAYSASEVRRIERKSGALLAVAPVRHPDNSSWARDGRLLVASHRGGFADEVRCQRLERGSCPMPFAVVALDSETLAGGEIFESSGAPMGAGTVAVDVGDSLWIGSFAGDRLLRVSGERVRAGDGL